MSDREAAEAPWIPLDWLLERGCDLVRMMHENDPAEPVADNGMTVWDAALVDWSRWADDATGWRKKLALQTAPDPREGALRLAQERVCAKIQAIMETYREQDARGFVGPGGLEHMGDVWSLLSEWDEALAKAAAIDQALGGQA